MFLPLHKYLQVFITSWENGFIYRLNFIMWRFRVVLQMLTVYFLWSSVLSNSPNAFGYTPAMFLTYILGTSLVRSIVFSSQSTGVQADIGSGDLNNHLTRPINYFMYWFSQDLADKLLNLGFAVIEISLFILLIKPPLVVPPSLPYLFLCIISVILAMVMYFFFSLIIALTTFWMPEGNGWPQRFFVYVILEFFAGGLFPLDILPQPLAQIVTRLPTAYMLNTPLQIYLGRVPFTEIITILPQMILWTVIFALIAQFQFRRGLRVYGAYGR